MNYSLRNQRTNGQSEVSIEGEGVGEGVLISCTIATKKCHLENPERERPRRCPLWLSLQTTWMLVRSSAQVSWYPQSQLLECFGLSADSKGKNAAPASNAPKASEGLMNLEEVTNLFDSLSTHNQSAKNVNTRGLLRFVLRVLCIGEGR